MLILCLLEDSQQLELLPELFLQQYLFLIVFNLLLLLSEILFASIDGD